MKPTGDKIAKGSCQSSYQIYCIDGEWLDTVLLNRTHLVLVWGPLVSLEMLQFGTRSEFYTPDLHVHIFLPLIRFLEFINSFKKKNLCDLYLVFDCVLILILAKCLK